MPDTIEMIVKKTLSENNKEQIKEEMDKYLFDKIIDDIYSPKIVETSPTGKYVIVENRDGSATPYTIFKDFDYETGKGQMIYRSSNLDFTYDMYNTLCIIPDAVTLALSKAYGVESNKMKELYNSIQNEVEKRSINEIFEPSLLRFCQKELRQYTRSQDDILYLKNQDDLFKILENQGWKLSDEGDYYLMEITGNSESYPKYQISIIKNDDLTNILENLKEDCREFDLEEFAASWSQDYGVDSFHTVYEIGQEIQMHLDELEDLLNNCQIQEKDNYKDVHIVKE